MSAKEMQTTEVQTTTHYWGYRELDSSELKHVGGGDDGDGGGGGDYGDYGAGCDFGGGYGGAEGGSGSEGDSEDGAASAASGFTDEGMCPGGYAINGNQCASATSTGISVAEGNVSGLGYNVSVATTGPDGWSMAISEPNSSYTNTVSGSMVCEPAYDSTVVCSVELNGGAGMCVWGM